MTNKDEYQQAMRGFSAQVRDLFTVPEGPAAAGPATRGAEELPVDLLAERSQALADLTQDAGQQTERVLAEGTPEEQEAAEIKLLAQASAQAAVARELLKIANEAKEENLETAAGVATRSARTFSLQQSMDELAGALEMPVELRMAATRGPGNRPDDPQKARQDLEKEIDLTLRQISRQAGRVGAQAVKTLLLMDVEVLKQGVAMISKDAAQLVDQVVAGVSRVIRNIFESAVRLLLQGYDWVLSLIGKDKEQKARQKVADWIEDLKQKPQGDDAGLVGSLVTEIYTPDAIKAEASEWLKASQSTSEQINLAAESVESLSLRFTEKTRYVENFLKAAGLVKALPIPLVKTPPFQVFLAGLLLGLFGYTLYTGYDHVDSGRVTFFNRFGIDIPDRVEGVRETVQKALGVTAAPGS